MATLDLLPNREFIITLNDGSKVAGKFGAWALKRFGEKHNYTLPDLVKAFTENLKLTEMVDYVLCAVEQIFREAKTGASFPHNDIDCSRWIDELGGPYSENFLKLWNHSQAADEQKKSEPGENPLA